MRRFIAKKTIKVPRYKLLYFILLVSILLIFVLNIFIKSYLKKVDKDRFLNLLVGNSFGNIIDKYSVFNYKYNIFYNNVFGFKLYESKPFFNDNKNNLSEIIFNIEPLIYIYNTFQTDKYVNNNYSVHSINSYVTQASLILQEYLKTNNIISLVEKNSVAKVLKDNNLDYTLSYRASRFLLEQAKKDNNTLNYFFDLGISDDNYNVTTTNINNLDYAKILFIVGTDNINYQLNQEFAKALNDKLLMVNSNLSRGISLRGGAGFHGVYNQDFSSNSLLIYVGGKQNSIVEVNRSLKILAEVISSYLKEEYYEKK